MTKQLPFKAIPERFVVRPATLWFDRFMNYFITVGGLSIILAVSLIFVFVLLQVLPLFRGARVAPQGSFSVPQDDYQVMGTDEWSELPFFVNWRGELTFVDTVDPGGLHHRRPSTQAPTWLDEVDVCVVAYNPIRSQLLYGTSDGRFAIVDVEYEATFPERGGREVSVQLQETPLMRISPAEVPVQHLAYGNSDTQTIVAAVQEVDDRCELHAVFLIQQRTLLGDGELTVGRSYDLTEHLDGKPEYLLVPSAADAVLLGMDDGRVLFLHFDGHEFHKRQMFVPFRDLADRRIASMDFLLGDVSLVFTATCGANRVFSLYRDPQRDARVWGHTKTFPDLERGARFYSAAMRNKAFLIGGDQFASLRYGTTESIRWEQALPFRITHAALGPRYDRLLFLDDQHTLHCYGLDDPHPQAAWRTFFGRIQYEGQSAPEFAWQSTGGRDDFERKLSLVPLIIGTLKGTFYAMIFALPIALLAAIYTSQFLRPEMKRFVKPVMEIMASLPSVVLGFLAALWLAPLISNAVPSVLLAMAAIIVAALVVGYLWGLLPQRIRVRLKPGYEFLAFLPVMLLVAYAGWQLGFVAERHWFVVQDPSTGAQIADFRLWFPHATGLSFEQRNAFVVGFVMGFAVIPIIFTITEDALSNVPEAFRSGSLALGASRWQTAIRIVLPTASAGIFSAIMIGLGRAVGETMIVVMATGNTPVTEFNPFTGMRTLSANIAVELPEAPYLGTLYRTLFLGALVLFLMTFLVNTIAEILRQHLREKYRAVE